jgi:AbiTii/TIR domain
MSLLREIQDGATEDTVSLGSLLRKVKLLAARIGVKEIGAWAAHELTGYDSVEELPSYRGPFEATVVGNGVGYGYQYSAYPIPRIAFEEKYRNSSLFQLYFLQGVAELESFAAAKETARAPWSSDIVATLPVLVQTGRIQLDPEIQWSEIWKPIPYPLIVGVLDAIRSRLLDFTMQIGEEEPAAEREQRITDPARVEQAARIFHTIIYANAANIAMGNRDVTQTQKPSTIYEIPLSSIPSLVQNDAPHLNNPDSTTVRDFDVFISHASEDKNTVVRPLARALSDKGLKVWYDEFELKIGDSLRRKIDTGLARSRFGVIVLSRSFFRKDYQARTD